MIKWFIMSQQEVSQGSDRCKLRRAYAHACTGTCILNWHMIDYVIHSRQIRSDLFKTRELFCQIKLHTSHFLMHGIWSVEVQHILAYAAASICYNRSCRHILDVTAIDFKQKYWTLKE